MAIMVDNVYGSCLQVKILSAHSVFDKTQDVVVEMQYNNTSNEIISIYKWCLPSNELNDPLFKVTCNNVPVRYVGPLIKRREPTIEDMTPLEPGKTKIIQARLSSAYDMTKTGIYSIQYDMPAERVVFKHARTFENVLFRTISKRHSGLESNNIQLIIEDRLNIQREQNRNMNVIKRAATLSYVSCSIIQKSQITNAVAWALKYADNSFNYLNKTKPSGTNRDKTWFVRRESLSIVGAIMLARMLGRMPMFWSAPMTGTDSKAGTLIHETSHFSVIVGTYDYAYGKMACTSLALSAPSQAIMNADSHEYFAENLPVLL
ncbi:unnamed protein product [Rotaria sp. Silwood2]|nr:unnamed protein product [Rotaria sp. Silwood2]CAF2598721.1 unnamed protein product [Rotaria sp. Silwood2]CAF3040446.1 unnamed protein product [Rotaria sp. Silwood2]CAF3342364.1 unnamed protein product [Rotaria sp. Silwood2]CAF4003583.1 unnamed protein product [Rotaria sp. Silwood2]